MYFCILLLFLFLMKKLLNIVVLILIGYIIIIHSGKHVISEANISLAVNTHKIYNCNDFYKIETKSFFGLSEEIQDQVFSITKLYQKFNLNLKSIKILPIFFDRLINFILFESDNSPPHKL